MSPGGVVGAAAIGGRPSARTNAGVPSLSETVALHALGWLVVVSSIGLLLSMLLVSPRLNAILAPWTYGRWAALHLDLALYGWLSLPIVGALLRVYGAEERPRASAVAVTLWSVALAIGAASWLGGRTSGRLFLDWSGGALALFVLAQLTLAATLAISEWRRRGAPGAAGRWLLLFALVAVPAAMLLVVGGDGYPAIDRSSGGPTGSSLLGSTLGFVAVLLATPWLLGRPCRDRRRPARAALLLALHSLVYLAFARGDHDHAEPLQIALLASTALWLWALPDAWSAYDWPARSRRWRIALVAWGIALVATGVLQFLPGWLERLKFTHELVAHAHLAMAGFASAFAGLVLSLLLVGTPVEGALDDRRLFLLWQGGTAAHLALLVGLGALEASDPAAFLRGGAAVEALLVARLAVGALLVATAVGWWRGVAEAPA